MSFFDLVVGKPLATTEERAEHIGPIAGIPVFGLDALSSAAYGPEAALTLLIPLGLAGIQHIVPISFAIIGLLAITRSRLRTSARTPAPSEGSSAASTFESRFMLVAWHGLRRSGARTKPGHGGLLVDGWQGGGQERAP
jgi:hypothetical protein